MFRLNGRELYTLNPQEFIRKGQEWLDLAKVAHPTIRIFSPNQDTFRPVQLPYATKSGENTRSPWPSDAKGFLYYARPPGAPPIASEVRFRLTPVNDPKAFDHGEDLHLSDERPWRRPIYSIATNSVLGPLYDKLRQEGLVSPELDKALKALPKLSIMYSRCQIVHSLSDTFKLDLSSDWHTLFAISEKGIAPIQILRQFRDLRLDTTPYKGAYALFEKKEGLKKKSLSGVVLARFEKSPFPTHSGTRTVVLRILKEIDAVQCLVPSYDEYIERPKAGQLFSKQYHGKHRPWSVDIDMGKLTMPGLRYLWDSTPKTVELAVPKHDVQTDGR